MSSKHDPLSDDPIDQWAYKLNSNLETGLTSAQADEYLKRDGLNELYKPPRPTLLMLFILQLTGFIIILLMIAAVASILVNATGSKNDDPLSYTTGIAIFIIVILNAGIAAYTENQAGNGLDALAKMSQATVTCIRDGEQVVVETPKLVRGDIVVLQTGDVIPADLRLLEADDVKVSEMCLTGEPEDVAKFVKKKERKHAEPEKLTPENMVFSSCNLTNGKGKGLVLETGMSTRIGRIAELMNGDQSNKKNCFCLPDTSANQTPLQHNVEALGQKIGVLAIIVCIIVFVVGWALETKDPENEDGPIWLYMILISVTLAVAAIPEGIPLCVTISLSIGCKDMVQQHVLVRKLAAVETLGSASVICSDKTGTLTEGKMTMVHMWSGDVKYDVSGKGFDPTVGTITRSEGQTPGDKEDPGVQSTLLTGLLCCNATLSCKTEDDMTVWEPKGNSSEAPIVVAARKIGYDTKNTDADYKRVLEVPFSSSRKMMLTVCKMEGGSIGPKGYPLPDGTQYLSVCKGAPNYIIDLCEFWVNADGTKCVMDEQKKAAVLEVVDAYSEAALRVLAIAINPMKAMPFDVADEDITTDAKFTACRQNLQLVGLVASIDPDRDGVKASVDTAHGASIRVVMITGDYLKTAIAIAKNVHILGDKDDPNTAAVDCGRLRPDGDYVSKAEIDAMTMRVKCFARAKPEDKIEIVKSFQRQGYVSAMTGDGVNDAPALSQADIGVAMGIQGTEVAKGAAEMVLTNDNFSSIVDAVSKGRVIYAGIQKFVAFIMSVHIAEVLQIFVCVVAKIPVMRTPLQILFLILVTDLPPSIALGMEPGDPSILELRPRPKTEPIMLMWMWISSCANGAILSAVIVFVYILSLNYYLDGAIYQDDILAIDGYEKSLEKARTVAFISLVFSENIRAYIARSFEKPFWVGFLDNKNMQIAIIAAQIALYLAVLVPFFSDKILGLRGVDIGLWGWLMSFVGPGLTLLFCEWFKIITAYQVKQYQAKIARDHEEAQRNHEKMIKAQLEGAEAAKVQPQPKAEKAQPQPKEPQVDPAPDRAPDVLERSI